MTLTQLAQKHNLEPERAKAFLREWVEQQKPVAWIRYRSDGLYEGPIMDHSKDMGEVRRQAGVWTPLIARPTDLGD